MWVEIKLYNYCYLIHNIHNILCWWPIKIILWPKHSIYITPCLPGFRNKYDLYNSNIQISETQGDITPLWPPPTINHCPNHGLGNIGLHRILTKIYYHIIFYTIQYCYLTLRFMTKDSAKCARKTCVITMGHAWNSGIHIRAIATWLHSLDRRVLNVRRNLIFKIWFRL